MQGDCGYRYCASLIELRLQLVISKAADELFTLYSEPFFP